MSGRDLDLDGGARFDCSEADLFRAALDTVRSLPGWEVLTAHPDQGEIHARQKGRIFSPTVDHLVRIRPGGPDDPRLQLELRTEATRTHEAVHDARSAALFQSLLVDRLGRGGDAFGALSDDIGALQGLEREGKH